jgi:hypothetical protein
MRRSLVTRRLSAALLVIVSALLFVAVAPLLWDARTGDIGRSLLGVQALQADTLVVDQPLRLSLAPSLMLASGIVTQTTSQTIGQTIGQTNSTTGAGRGVVLSSAVLELDLAGSAPIASAAGTAVRGIFSPVLDHIAALSIDTIALRKTLVRVRLAHGQTLDLQDIDAVLTARNGQIASAVGRLSYLGEAYKFDTQIGPPVDRPVDRQADAEAPQGVRRTVLLKVSAPSLSVAFDGHAEGTGGLAGLRGTADVRTIDAGKLFAALGFRWSAAPAGPEVLIKGPVRWASGTISFGRSEVSLGDQAGVGALTISMSDNRPRIEATLAFPALDVAPLLASERSATGVANAPWRSISTSFPFSRRLDAELRLSAARLQWNGAPIGKGAITVSASGGKLHGDIAELQLDNHLGSLQFAIDHTQAAAPVSLRGRFETGDVAGLSAQLLGIAPMRGRATSTFDFSSRGATLGDVLDRANGRGTMEMRDGQMLMDLVALQKQIAVVSGGEKPAGWGVLAQIAPMDALDAKFQVRDGAITFEHLGIVSKGLVANVQGRLSLPNNDIDVKVRFAPAASARAALSRSIAAGTPRTATSGAALSVRGPWSAPLLSATDIELTP